MYSDFLEFFRIGSEIDTLFHLHLRALRGWLGGEPRSGARELLRVQHEDGNRRAGEWDK